MNESAEYIPIRTSTLRGDLQIPFDVYVKVAGKYIHYCRSGTSFEGARLDRLKSKKISRMFIKPDDQPAYQAYLNASIDAAYANNPAKPLAIRAEVIQGFQQAAAEECMENPHDEDAYRHVRSSVARFVEFIGHEPLAAGALLNIENSDRSISHHSVNVATLATAMAMRVNPKEGKLALLSLGCLLHDIEHFHAGPEMVKPRGSFTPAELEKYRAHPLEGLRRFQGATFVDQLVMNVITQHEEHMDGSGFPKKLKEDEMDPLVVIAATANAYDRLVSFEGLSPKDALKTLLINKMGLFPLSLLQTLQDILKVQKLI